AEIKPSLIIIVAQLLTPPPQCRAVLAETVLWSSANRAPASTDPRWYMPPPSFDALFVSTVLFVSVSTPALATPPPLEKEELATIALALITAVAELTMPAPNDAVLPVIVLPDTSNQPVLTIPPLVLRSTVLLSTVSTPF